MKKTKTLLFALLCFSLIACAASNSPNMIDIVVSRKLADEDRQIVASYIWKSLGSDIKIGIATVGEETAFSFEYDGTCEGIDAFLPLLDLKYIGSADCLWVSPFNDGIKNAISNAL
jgi:hypothetical protein